MAQRSGQFNFSKGELAEELVARVDVASYQSGVKQARNVLVLKYGGLTKRPGTRFVAEAYNANYPVRLIPFQFSLTQAYAIEFGQSYMRPAALGGLVLEDRLKITAITKAANAKVTAAYHSYSVGDQVYFQQITGMTQINGMTGTVVSVVDTNNFTVNINSTSFSTFTGSDGTARSAPPTPPPPPPSPPPSPPPVPAPPPPPPPSTGGGGSYVGEDPVVRCVVETTLILLANEAKDGPGMAVPIGMVRVGELVWTQHHETLEWGAYPVIALERAYETVFKVHGLPRASWNHRTYEDGAWQMLHNAGEPDGWDWVIKLSVDEAQTFFTPGGIEIRDEGVLSHNVKPITT